MPRPVAGGIVVVVGYYAFGSTISITLAQHFPGDVFAADRSVEKAEAFSRRTGHYRSAARRSSARATPFSFPNSRYRARASAYCVVDLT